MNFEDYQQGKEDAITSGICDKCQRYDWYYDRCKKWNCECDARECHSCFEPVESGEIKKRKTLH